MKIYILIMLSFQSLCFSQDLEKIKSSDTIYIYFKRDKNQFANTNNNLNLNNLNYYYNFGYVGTFQNTITFMHHYSLSPEERKEKKSFLRKNKDLIITYEFLIKFNLEKATDLIVNKKKVYMIDFDEIGWFFIKLKEVKVLGTYKPSIE